MPSIPTPHEQTEALITLDRRLYMVGLTVGWLLVCLRALAISTICIPVIYFWFMFFFGDGSWPSLSSGMRQAAILLFIIFGFLSLVFGPTPSSVVGPEIKRLKAVFRARYESREI